MHAESSTHPFLSPHHAAEDARQLTYMMERLFNLPEWKTGVSPQPRPLILSLPEETGRQHRLILSNEQKLFTGEDLTVVGFFGQKKKNYDRDLLAKLDEELVALFRQNPHLLSYNSLELHPGGDWGNLVLFSAPAGIEHWRSFARHEYATRVLAPTVYEAVRIHNGVIRGGLKPGAEIALSSTKFFEYP